MFANMKLRTKLAATGVALLLPLIWVTYLLSDEMDIRINFGAQEILGVEYLNPLQNLLDQAGEYKVAVAANNSVTQIVSRIEKAMSALEKEQQRSGVALKTAEQYANLLKVWGQARTTPSTAEADALIAAARELIARAGDTSNLILDPDLDTYYVMDALLLKLPNSLDLLAQMREFGTGLMNSGSMSADDKTRMVVLSGLLQSDLDGVIYDSKVAYENNAAGDMPKSVGQAVESYTQAIGNFLGFVEKNITGRSLNVDVNGFKSAAQRAVESNMALYQQASPALKNMLQRRIDGFSSHKFALLAGVIVFELLAIVFSVMTVRRILNQLGGEPEYAADIVRAIAAGDLTRDVKINDGDATSLLAGIRNMQKSLQDLIGKVSDSASKILSFAAEITQTTEAIVTSSSRQSHATATMSSAVQEVAASLHEMVASAGEARSLSLESNQRSSEGKDIVEQVSEDIRRLCNFVGDSAKSVQSLGQQSEQIYSIVNVIKGIAEQTNLLALNAAIEAARAGEQGRGFAVVADEVRNLAARTASSTVEITDMIQRIKDDTLAVVKRMDSGVEEASRSAGRVTLTVDAIAAISDLSESVNRSVTEISTALEQQAQANELLSENVDEIAQLAEQNHGSVEKTADNLSELKALADTLEAAIASFKV
ncbi:Methyl-accepting chemotaxis protein [Hahella chejuensis KCTC 2396]|uniref:Methyl-accepting chemotaxis protein n=1 Tax=Hahella chejuensis (strain KCTC 2396) TaxID=349521 RepID=Q2SCT1_HAHCH|nr:methyl-accepting chemotaxis protein [Hahella chejuensis]ABC31543.1 Methyl-accepting chemotaxis protein [Hahella chejuensis KCTC 2396]